MAAFIFKGNTLVPKMILKMLQMFNRIWFIDGKQVIDIWLQLNKLKCKHEM